MAQEENNKRTIYGPSFRRFLKEEWPRFGDLPTILGLTAVGLAVGYFPSKAGVSRALFVSANGFIGLSGGLAITATWAWDRIGGFDPILLTPKRTMTDVTDAEIEERIKADGDNARRRAPFGWRSYDRDRK